VSPRARSVLFAAGALVCAGLSATLADGAPSAEESYGELRSVAVTRTALERGVSFGSGEVRESLEQRRVPAAFVPPDALAMPQEALGRRVAIAVPPGSYLTASMLAADGVPERAGPPEGTTPVELTVTGAGALAAARSRPGMSVDVVVSGASGPGPATGRTYVAAAGVPLLDLRKAAAETGFAADRWIATLAVNRDQALRLIRAESTARAIRLLAR
jgi:SAF domain